MAGTVPLGKDKSIIQRTFLDLPDESLYGCIVQGIIHDLLPVKRVAVECE